MSVVNLSSDDDDVVINNEVVLTKHLKRPLSLDRAPSLFARKKLALGDQGDKLDYQSPERQLERVQSQPEHQPQRVESPTHRNYGEHLLRLQHVFDRRVMALPTHARRPVDQAIVSLRSEQMQALQSARILLSQLQRTQELIDRKDESEFGRSNHQEWINSAHNLKLELDRVNSNIRATHAWLVQFYGAADLPALMKLVQDYKPAQLRRMNLESSTYMAQSSRPAPSPVSLLARSPMSVSTAPTPFSPAPFPPTPYSPSSNTLFNQRSYSDALVDREELDKLFDNIGNNEISVEGRANTPSQLRITLLEHQRIGLAWLLKMEESVKGGLLADDMGLGKTIQMLSLIMASPPPPGTPADLRTTLIVAPVALLQQWERELKSRVKPEFEPRIYIHHGTQRKHRDWAQFQRYDVILTSYGSLVQDFKKHFAKELYEEEKTRRGNHAAPPRRAEPSPFYQGTFFRIILDEAQMIKNKATRSANACCALKATYRWCLSGTPMQNNVIELFSLVKFLQIPPYHDEKKFMADIGRGLKDGKVTTTAMRKLQVLLKSILLRRTKESKIDGKPILTLPPKLINLDKNNFDEDEESMYRHLEFGVAQKVNKYLNTNTFGKNYSNILTLLLRLRQACCHPKLIERSERSKTLLEGIRDRQTGPEPIRNLPPDIVKRIISDAEDSTNCPVCHDVVDTYNTALLYPCGHLMCSECIIAFFEQEKMKLLEMGSDAKILCPYCDRAVDDKKVISYRDFSRIHVEGLNDAEFLARRVQDDSRARQRRHKPTFKKLRDERRDLNLFADDLSVKPEQQGDDAEWAESELLDRLDLKDLFPEGFISSTKIDRCMSIIDDVQTNYPGEKIIVFSLFTSFLDFLEVPLYQRNVPFLRYDGSMNALSRNDAVIEFFNDPQARVMLISLKAGNVGLTLTCASHVILMDPFWNPYVEDQAMDRAHRIGQVRKVHVHRLVIENSVEDRILTLQRKKRELIEGALNDQKLKSIASLDRRQLLYLFGLGGEPTT